MLAEMFEALFPEYYQRYRKAFDAGVWLRADPGPYLGRAAVYKMQVSLHKDTRDDGPCASFPSGLFHGGALQMPQMRSKFS